jgi:hypothetical protein
VKRVLLIATIIVVGIGGAIPPKTGLRPFASTPYCEIARNAASYHGKTVRAKARLILGSGGGMYVFENCDPVSALASLVELEGAETNRLKGNYVEEVLVAKNQENVSEVDAIISGRFNGEFSRGCWAPAFHIAATEIEFISPLTKYEVSAISDYPMRTKH